MRVFLFILILASTVQAAVDDFGPYEMVGTTHRAHDPYKWSCIGAVVVSETATTQEVSPVASSANSPSLGGSSTATTPDKELLVEVSTSLPQPMPVKRTLQLVANSAADIQKANDLLRDARYNNGYHETCVPLYRDALVLFQKHEDSVGMASCYTGLGMNHAGAQNFDSAIDILRMLKATNETNNMWAQCQLGQANYLRSREGGHNNEAALAELREARVWATDQPLRNAIDRAIGTCRFHLDGQQRAR